MEPVFQELYDFPEEASTVTFPPVSDGAWRAARRRPVPLASLRPSVSATFTFFFFFSLRSAPVTTHGRQTAREPTICSSACLRRTCFQEPSQENTFTRQSVGGTGGGTCLQEVEFPRPLLQQEFPLFPISQPPV